MYLGIEIGGTKLQLGVGEGDGQLLGLWRGTVEVATGPEGIRRQIVTALPELLASAGLGKCHLHGVGIGFGGPVDDATSHVIKSHQIQGWDDFPLSDWIGEVVGLPAVLGNDADVAGLAEALHGAGKGLSPIFYITIGSGIGGGLIIDGEIYRGVGRGAAEIGHLRVEHGACVLEEVASGWGLQRLAQALSGREGWTVPEIAHAAKQGDKASDKVLRRACEALSEAICHVVALLCPRRIVIGGGVSLLGDQLFVPLRQKVAERVFRPFAGLTDIVPAALGEGVVVHGALALAKKAFGQRK